MLKIHYYVRNGSDLKPNKARFWGTENHDIEVQSGEAFEMLLTAAPPLAIAQETSYKIGVSRILGEIEVSVAR